ncbi:MAG TPA: hypothetical protein VFK05_37560 [Polyangiaceae bacterium]|nr:hypothetical protein [Polyangiaceae bacterium]
MTIADRITRPEPDRTGPHRAFVGTAPSTPAATSSGRYDPTADANSAFADSRETAYEAVNNAYSVIDEYMRQGQKIAEGLWMPTVGANSGAPKPLNAAEHLMRAFGDMTLAWAELMQQFSTGAGLLGGANALMPFGRPRVDQPTGGAGAFTAGRVARDATVPAAPAAPAPATRPAVPPPMTHAGATTQTIAVSVVASRPVEVSVELNGAPELARLVATALRAANNAAPALAEPELRLSEGGAASLRVVVPEQQAAGVYNGLLLDRESQRARGTITLVVS